MNNNNNKNKQKKKPSGPKRQVSKTSKKNNHNKYNSNTNSTKTSLSVVKQSKMEPLVASYSISKDKPKYDYQKDGSLVLTNVEMLNSVTTLTTNTMNSPNGFNLIGFMVNAGLKSTFPFLSNLAGNYTSYDFETLCFGFVPRLNYTVNGTVMMFAEYDTSQKAPENRIELLNRSGKECQVFKPMQILLPYKDLKKEKSHYVRVGKLSTNQDIKLYDAATFWFAYEGTPSNTLIGDIIVAYRCRLTTPYLRLAEKQIKSTETCVGSSSGTVTVQQPFGPAMTAAKFAGDFIGNLLYTAANTATGGLIGQVFSTGKSIVKLISTFTRSPDSNSNIPDSYVPQISIPATNVSNYFGGSNFVSDQVLIVTEDDLDLLATANGVANMTVYNNLFTDITSTNAVALADSFNVIAGTGTRYTTWAVVVPANSLIRIYNKDTTHLPASASISFSDYDARKTGNLPANQVLYMGND